MSDVEPAPPEEPLPFEIEHLGRGHRRAVDAENAAVGIVLDQSFHVRSLHRPHHCSNSHTDCVMAIPATTRVHNATITSVAFTTLP